MIAITKLFLKKIKKIKRVYITSNSVWKGSLHIFTETQQSLLIFVNVLGKKKKSLQHFICCIYLQILFFGSFDVFRYLFISSFLSLCLYLNFLPSFSLPNKTSWRHLETQWDTCLSMLTESFIRNCGCLWFCALQCVWLFCFLMCLK